MPTTITKKDLMDRVADAADERRSRVKAVVQAFLDEMVEELARGNRLEFRDFGVFETKVRKARRAQNPRKRQAVWVPQRTTVKFKLGRLLKQRLAELDERENTAAGGGPPPEELKGSVAKTTAPPKPADPEAQPPPGATPPPAGG